MTKLLRAGIRRYTHSVIFWLSLILIIGIAAVCGYETRQYYLDDVFIFVTLFVNAILISWHIGRENEEGIFRNKVVSGHSKGSIFLSELILSVGVSLIFSIIFALIFLLFNTYIIGHASVVICIKLFLGYLLMNISLAVILVIISTLIPRRAIVGIVNILLVLAFVAVPSTISDVLNKPEYWTGYEYEQVTMVDEEGNTFITEQPIQGTEVQIPNEDYVDGALRVVLEAVHIASPYTSVTKGIEVTYYWFGYEQIETMNERQGTNITYEEQVDFTVSNADILDINTSLIVITIEFIVLCLVGYLCFRKKELK